MKQKAQELLMPMAMLTLRYDFAGGHTQGRKQRGRAVADIIMRDAFGVPKEYQLTLWQEAVCLSNAIQS